jgi:hypothetical protein
MRHTVPQNYQQCNYQSKAFINEDYNRTHQEISCDNRGE